MGSLFRTYAYFILLHLNIQCFSSAIIWDKVHLLADSSDLNSWMNISMDVDPNALDSATIRLLPYANSPIVRRIQTEYFINIIANNKSELNDENTFNITILSVYVDPLHFGKQNNECRLTNNSLLDWCRNEFFANLTTGGVSSRNCPDCQMDTYLPQTLEFENKHWQTVFEAHLIGRTVVLNHYTDIIACAVSLPSDQRYFRVHLNEELESYPQHVSRSRQQMTNNNNYYCSRNGSMIFSVVKSLSPLGKTHTDLHVMLDMLDDDRKSLDSNCTSQNNSSSMVKRRLMWTLSTQFNCSMFTEFGKSTDHAYFGEVILPYGNKRGHQSLKIPLPSSDSMAPMMKNEFKYKSLHVKVDVLNLTYENMDTTTQIDACFDNISAD